MQKEQFLEILRKYQEGDASAEEIEFLRTYYSLFELEPEILNSLKEKEKAEIKDRIENRLMEQIAGLESAGKKKSYRWIAAAASILLFLSVGAYFIVHKPVKNPVAILKPGTFKNDVLPGNKAVLTLANGQKIIVNQAQSGTIAIQGSTSISKSANGAIIYAPATASAEIAYNTYAIPRGGGKHALILADGTLAVLDAGSSIRYPVAFTGKDRKVEITGQVYFEVVHDPAKLFSVITRGQTIEDIGTHFNVNAFADEPAVKTTLIEGSIKIAGHILKPGQQAVTTSNGRLTIENNVDLEQVIAWKNDKFEFNKHTDLQAVMRQLSRWYDLDVAYQGASKQYHLAGDMPRDSKLSDVLKILEYNGLQFSIDGQKLTVYQ